jgi:hypothetical protein
MFSLDLGKEITLLNVYGPYVDRVEYWDKFFHMEWLQSGLVVVGGDLNFPWEPQRYGDQLHKWMSFLVTLLKVGRSRFTGC